MGVEVAGSCFPLSQPLLPHHHHHHHHSSPQTIASVFSSISSSSSSSTRRRRRGSIGDHTLAFHPLHHQPLTDHRSPFLGASSRSRSCEITTGGGWRRRRHRRVISATLAEEEKDDEDEEFIFRLQELAMNLHQDSEMHPDSRNQHFSSPSPILHMKHQPSTAEPPWPPIRPEEPAGWPEEVMVAASLERRASSVDLPVSLRMIKKKKRWEEGMSTSTHLLCSVKRAFSSMVFIIREIQSYTLQMREVLFLEDLHGILERVHGEMHASFVWLFQHIFSRTPTLMLSLMLLLANFTVHSMAHATTLTHPPTASSATVIVEEENQQQQRFDSSSVKTFSVGGGRSASVGGGSGGGGGGGKASSVAGDMGDGQSAGSSSLNVVVNGTASTTEEEEEEAVVWNKIVEEAWRMQAAGRDEVLMDEETLQRLVSPVTVVMEAEDPSAYLQTELMYHHALSQDPTNTTLLTNFAQFLHLVLHDHDRAEYYFKIAATRAEPADAEAWSRYATFLWLARKDIGEAEEAFLEAIAADPGNTFHAANYANFLWNTGGEDTCYPLSS